MTLVQKELKNAYIGIPNPTSITLDKSPISLTTIGQTEQLTATIEPTISDHSITWSSDDTTVAIVSTTGLVTCVTPGECTITATTVNGITASCSVVQGRLPSAYQEVEWIKASGTQYIAPGVTIEAGTKIKIEADIYITGNGCIYGEFSGVNPDTLYQIGIDNNNFFARIDNAANGSLPTTRTPNTYTVNTRYNIISEGTATYNQLYAPLLFAQNGGWYSSNQLYSFKIWKDDVLVRDLVPCYRIADTVIGLYDVVNNQFYINSGTGTFTKGPDV